ncbi:MAG TPA: hypothetical protein DCG49_11680 [Ruminococcus sp.]|nr:hypothetical protein [Ruminococcus sp.]
MLRHRFLLSFARFAPERSFLHALFDMIESNNRKELSMYPFLSCTGALLLAALILSGCARFPLPDLRQCAPPSHTQTVEQLHLAPQNQQPLYAAWIPYFACEPLFASGDAAAVKSAVTDLLRSQKENGITTVFVHVCAFGEAGYPSAFYPRNPAVNGYDTLQILSDVCAALGLELHAWINPLRLQTTAAMQKHHDDALLSHWFQDEQLRKENLVLWDGRWYLNPASDAVKEFLAGAVQEIMTQYHPAGIHIDDYFYPTTDPAFDAAAFEASGASDLAAWRREHITNLMKTLRQAVHQADPDGIFSVSPQGDLQKNYDTLYADVAAWCADGTCCDLVIPQLYFGYEHETAPFSALLDRWKALPLAPDVRLAAGLAAYKAGNVDAQAGSGAQEWVTHPDVLQRQINDVLSDPAFSGVVLYNSFVRQP